MILHHFTSKQHLPLIQTEGLTKGVIPWTLRDDGSVGMVPGWQWLTQNPSWDQDWARRMVDPARPIRRDAYRISLTIPDYAIRKLYKWAEISSRYNPHGKEYIESFPEHVDWFIFFGQIQPRWFIKVERNPFREDLVLDAEP